jgi:hypothetical protein
MNPKKPTLVSSSRNSQARSRLLPFTASRVSKLAACLILGVATLSQSARSAPSYATAVLSDNPAAFWQLNETGNPSTGTLTAADSSGNGHNGTYGTTSQNGFQGILGPQPPTYQGFAAGQGALQCTAADVNSVVTLPPLNLSSSVVDTTIAMWINPAAQPPTDGGLLFDRSGGAATVGFGFGGQDAGLGLTRLGYNWNDSGGTWSWNSSLYPPLGVWSFVVLVVETNRATIYLCYIDSVSGQPVLSSAVNTFTHSAATWSGAGPRWLGGDNNNANRTFPGAIAGAAVYNTALTADQILTMFTAGVGVNGFGPSIGTQPQSRYVISGSQTQLRTTVNGSSPLAYQWKLNGTNVNLLPNSANYTGANSNVLSIVSATAAEAGSYQLIVTNLYGTALSSNALLTIQAPSLVGKWFTNNSLADVSGYTPAGIHDAFPIGGLTYEFSTNVPSGKTGQSVLLSSASGFAISNSSTLDVAYTNTFDERINNAMTVQLWAKGWPGTWNPFVSKYGESGLGWQIRQFGQDGINPCWTIRGAGGTVTLGVAGLYSGPDDLAATGFPLGNDTNNWHFYVGTYDAATGDRHMYIDGQLAASATGSTVYALSPASYLSIGARDNGGNSFGNYFNGQIYDARVYNYAVTHSEVLIQYGVNPPTVAVQPKSVSVFAGETARVSATVSGTPPLAFQWQFNGTNVNLLPNIANYTGANSNVLSILSLSTTEAGSYKLIVTNIYGTAISSNAIVALSEPKLVGRWFNGSASLADVSGYQPAGTHDGYAVGAANYVFTNDVPPGLTGQSILFPASDSGIAISNSSTADGATYTNTFDSSAFSVSFWAKDRGPGGANWLAWVAKDGYNNNGEYNGIGWSVGIEAWSQYLYFAMEGIDNGGITYTLGDGLWGNGILQCNPQNLPGDNTTWHHYAVTYSAATGVRRTYFDGTLVAQQNGCAQYDLAADKHLTIACQEQTVAGFTGLLRGFMYDVSIFNYTLTSNQVVAMLPDPVISVQPPQTLNAYVGNVAQISATALTQASPVTNHWQLDGTNLVDGALGSSVISGANTTTLMIGNVTTNLQGVYRLIVSNPKGTVISSNTTVTVLSTVPPPAGNLVGAWITGAANLADTSGYSPAATHDGYGVAGTGSPSSNYGFTNDVPLGWSGQSLVLPETTGIAISNSSTLDASYVNTFDDTITNMTVAFWAKGVPSGGWNPFVSKFGESGQGWQLRRNGGANPTWTVRGTGATEDMSAGVSFSSDGLWHHYAGTFTFDGATGSRNLYVDGVLVASQTETAPYILAAGSYLCLGGRHDGSAFGNYFAGGIYGARIYSAALTEAQVNSLAWKELVVPVTAPAFSGPPTLAGSKFILSWSGGTLLQSTNVLGPWTSSGATSPYTNIISTAPQMFFKLSNP